MNLSNGTCSPDGCLPTTDDHGHHQFLLVVGVTCGVSAGAGLILAWRVMDVAQ
jgi:hypothetical protein